MKTENCSVKVEVNGDGFASRQLGGEEVQKILELIDPDTATTGVEESKNGFSSSVEIKCMNVEGCLLEKLKESGLFDKSVISSGCLKENPTK